MWFYFARYLAAWHFGDGCTEEEASYVNSRPVAVSLSCFSLFSPHPCIPQMTRNIIIFVTWERTYVTLLTFGVKCALIKTENNYPNVSFFFFFNLPEWEAPINCRFHNLMWTRTLNAELIELLFILNNMGWAGGDVNPWLPLITPF